MKNNILFYLLYILIFLFGIKAYAQTGNINQDHIVWYAKEAILEKENRIKEIDCYFVTKGMADIQWVQKSDEL